MADVDTTTVSRRDDGDNVAANEEEGHTHQLNASQRSKTSRQSRQSTSSRGLSSSSSLAKALRTVDTSGIEYSDSTNREHALLDINPELEDETLGQLKERVDADCPLGEFWMRVCLRAKGYDVQRAADGLKAYAAWRSTYEINERPLHRDEQLLSLVRHGVVEAPCFLDKGGHHVIMVRMARAEPSRWTPQDAVRCMHVAVEYAFLRYPLAQRRGLAFMIDMRNISSKNMDIRVPRALLTAFANHLPLRFGAVYLINPPLFMRMALNLVKLLLKRKLQRRVHIIKGDVCNGDDILKYFDRRQLPTDMNGACAYDHTAYTSLVEAIHTLYPTPERFLQTSAFDRHPAPTSFIDEEDASTYTRDDSGAEGEQPEQAAKDHAGEGLGQTEEVSSISSVSSINSNSSHNNSGSRGNRGRRRQGRRESTEAGSSHGSQQWRGLEVSLEGEDEDGDGNVEVERMIADAAAQRAPRTRTRASKEPHTLV